MQDHIEFINRYETSLIYEFHTHSSRTIPNYGQETHAIISLIGDDIFTSHAKKLIPVMNKVSILKTEVYEVHEPKLETNSS